MSDRHRELLRDPELRREFERESLYESAVLDIEGIMKTRDLSQGELAKRLGVSPGRISQLLSGRRNLTLKTLADMAWALGLKVTLELDAIDDLASTPAKDDSPVMPEWLNRRKVQSARAVSQEKVKMFVPYGSAVAQPAGTRRRVNPRRVRQFDPHGDRSSIAA